jgi:hypothetical protein
MANLLQSLFEPATPLARQRGIKQVQSGCCPARGDPQLMHLFHFAVSFVGSERQPIPNRGQAGANCAPRNG